MFDFLYSASYDDQPPPPPSDESGQEAPDDGGAAASERVPLPWRRVLTNAKVYVMADKYVIDGLKDAACRKFEASLAAEWSEAGFISVVEYLYAPEFPAGSSLSTAVLSLAMQRISHLKASKRFHEILRDGPELGYDFTSLMMQRVVDLEGNVG